MLCRDSVLLRGADGGLLGTWDLLPIVTGARGLALPPPPRHVLQAQSPRHGAWTLPGEGEKVEREEAPETGRCSNTATSRSVCRRAYVRPTESVCRALPSTRPGAAGAPAQPRPLPTPAPFLLREAD